MSLLANISFGTELFYRVALQKGAKDFGGYFGAFNIVWLPS